MSEWFETLDLEALLAARDLQRDEAMTGANVGSYSVPVGPMLRRQIPGSGAPSELPDCEGDAFCPLDPALWSASRR